MDTDSVETDKEGAMDVVKRIDAHKCTKSYDRVAHNIKFKEDNRKNDNFDKLLEKEISLLPDLQEWEELNEKRGEALAVEETYTDLFTDPEKAEKVESSPKKAKRMSRLHPKRERKTLLKKNNFYTSLHKSFLFTPMKMHPKTQSQKSTTPVEMTALNLPSIEKCRDAWIGASPWNFDPGQGTQTLLKPLLVSPPSPRSPSLSSSPSPPSHHQWTPTGIRKRSFIKIRTPAHLAGRASGSRDSNSYTSVNTWTTATSTNTNTASLTVPAGPGLHGWAGRESGEGGSPTLMLKSCSPDNLHSTALHPGHNVGHVQCSPLVSPIHTLPGDNPRPHYTPSAPTHSLSPRGPRKVQSFLVQPPRRLPPKCSTMLFSPPMADAGDAPLDVSSIRLALSEAIDLQDGPVVGQGLQQEPDICLVDMAPNVLTSTPCGSRKRKPVQWDVSSVQAVPEDGEDPLHFMQTTGDVVNSQEIVAITISDSSGGSLVDQEESEGRLRPKAVCSPGRLESGIVVDSPTSCHDKHSLPWDGRQETRRENSDIAPCLDAGGDRPRHIHSNTEVSDRSAGVKDTGRSPGLKDAASSLLVKDTVRSPGIKDTTSSCVKDTGRSPRLKEIYVSMDKEVQWTSDSSYCYELSVDDRLNFYSPTQQAERQHLRQEKQEAIEGTVMVEPCPLTLPSSNPHHCPVLTLGKDPRDSGFLEMCAKAPPDIIGVVSKATVNQLMFGSSP